MLKISLKQGQYVNIGDNIRVVYVGGTGNHGRLMIDAPKEVKIARSTVEQNPERRKDTYYPEPAISKEAQDEIKKILWNERMKAEAKRDAEKMKEAAKYFEGEHDFKAFKSSGTSGKNSVRTIYKAEVRKEGDNIIIELTGNGFLYNMVRIISGTLLDVGLGKIKPEGIPEIIESKDRQRAGRTLPAHGLYLVQVVYN